MLIGSLSPAVQTQTNIDPDRGGMEERRKRVSVHAGCWLHRIISKASPPTTLTPVAEKNVNSCMAGGQHCMRGQRGAVRRGVHFKRKAVADKEFNNSGNLRGAVGEVSTCSRKHTQT